MRKHVLPPLLALASSGVASAQELLIVESSNDAVMKFSAVDGSLIDAVFIDLTTSTGSAPSTPIEAIEAGDEFWISDQLADVIFRFDSAGTYLGEYAAGRDNMRGIGLGGDGNVWVSNSGTGGAGFGDVIKEYATDGTFIASYAAGDPFDCQEYFGSILVSNILLEQIDEFDYDGNFLGPFSGATSINFPEQITVRSNGNILVAGFSTPSGIYEYDPAGNEVNFIDTGAIGGQTGLRGVHELENGNIIFTNGNGVHVYDAGMNTITTVHGGVSGRFVHRLAEGQPCPDVVYCDTNPDNVADIDIDTCDCSAGSITISMSNAPVPDGNAAYLLISASTGVVTDPPGATGDLCLAGSPIGRYAADVANITGGGISTDILNANTAGGGGNLPVPPGGNVCSPAGQTWNFQFWHRGGATNPSRFSKAMTVTFR